MTHDNRPETKGDRYRLIEDDPEFRMAAGDVLICEAYWLDPGLKLTVLRREADGFDPCCNVYRHQVRRIRPNGDEVAVRCRCSLVCDERWAEEVRAAARRAAS